MLKLNFNLRHQAITLLNPGTIVATDSKNYLVANFNFISDDWEYPLTAVFTSDVEKIPYTILVGQSDELEENECFIPWEVLQSSGNVYVSVFCGELHTTNTVKFKVVKSGYTEGEIPPSPTPTIYEQILQALDSKQPMLTAGQNITITEENVISAEGGSNDYTDLTNKPSINNVTLSGNKSSDDLSLQGKLTAGNNITIENNVISAEGGGVTSYNDLTDKPQIYVPVYNSFNELVGNENITIEDIINMTYGFCVRIDSQENKSLEPYNIYNHSLYSDKDLLVGRSISYYGKYDFDKLSNDLRCAGMWEARASQCKHVPAFISDLFVSGLSNYIFFITHYRSHVGVAGGAPMIRSVAGKDKNGDFRIYYQYIRLSDNNDGTISNQSDWVELTGGGSQIVSGVVNANGTITFTDSDGNTFTTSGSSVIGADGFSPSATVQQTASGATVSITDKNGTTTANISNGQDGNDYVLTAQDKSDIADIVLSELPNADTMSF